MTVRACGSTTRRRVLACWTVGTSRCDTTARALRYYAGHCAAAATTSTRYSLITIKFAACHTTMAPPYDFSRLWDGKEDVGAAAASNDPEEHLEFGGHKGRHQGYMTRQFQKRDRERSMRTHSERARARSREDASMHRPTTASSCGWASPLPRGPLNLFIISFFFPC